MQGGGGEKTSFEFLLSDNLTLGRQADETQDEHISLSHSTETHLTACATVFPAYVNGAAQYPSYQTVMVSTP